MPVTFPEAALGAEIKVPVHRGQPKTVRIAPGTANGRVLRVRGQGAARRDGTRGDLLVTVDVQVPTEIDETTREALEKISGSLGGDDLRSELLRLAREE